MACPTTRLMASGGFGGGDGISQNGASAFADVVAIPRGNIHDYVAFYYGLATQARPYLEVGSLLHAIEFVVFHLREILFTLLDYYVTRGAGAVSSTGMLQVEAVIHGDV